ncbi:hypothetical protein LTR62_006718 [Meristemomyces frigidus]|uniref:Rhodopsin domain-containing protein n=1 Tax=Meristemomyces frigidus TaxID=1508187 RepID=A0AAN7TIK0_9PEZI|nr:hypothetical protein LTR62_006718 [Meristemomyces frigidus]
MKFLLAISVLVTALLRTAWSDTAAQNWLSVSCNAPRRNLGGTTSKISGVLIGFIALAIIFRFMARMTFLESKVGADDWTILVAFILLIPSTAIVQLMTWHGLGKDIWFVSANNVDTIFFYFYIGEFFYFPIVALTKISIILLYLRIFPSSISTRFRTISYILIGLITAYAVTFTILLGFECTPISYVWKSWDGEHEGKCLELVSVLFISSALNIIFDIFVMVLPIPKLVKLHVNHSKKVGILITFMLGVFVTACSVIRLLYFTEWSGLPNVTYHYNAITLWSNLEAGLSVFCACMPTVLGPVMYFFRQKVGTRGSRTNTSATTPTASRIRRLPSTASEPEERQEELVKGGIRKTIYTMPYEQDESDVELVAQESGFRLRTTGPLDVPSKNPKDYRHEYTDSWR